MQSTSVCQWKFGESQPGECKKGCLCSVTVPAFAGKNLTGVERLKKEKCR